jgi:hypothetical protein
LCYRQHQIWTFLSTNWRCCVKRCGTQTVLNKWLMILKLNSFAK